VKLCNLLLLSLMVGLVSAGNAQAQDEIFTNSLGLEFVLITPVSSFLSRGGEIITIQPFYLGKHEVTQERWEAVMGSNPSHFKGQNHPVENISWDDAQEFIRRLNASEGHGRYRLPTVLEWELAARGGQNTRYFFMKADPETLAEEEEEERLLAEYAWFRDNSDDTTHPVGLKKPNPYGLYDIYGNVREWVQDRADNTGQETGGKHMCKGGSFDWGASFTGPGTRTYPTDKGLSGDIGFRLALEAASGEPRAKAENSE